MNEYSQQLLLLLLLLSPQKTNCIISPTGLATEKEERKKGKKRHRTNHPMQSGGPSIIKWARWVGLEIIIRIIIIKNNKNN